MESGGNLCRRKKHGFTLIELLVVIAIISVLAALLLPALRGAIATSRSILCVNNQKQHHLAMTMYADAWEVYPPTWHWPDGQKPNGYAYRKWFQSLKSEGVLDSPGPGAGELFWCPEKKDVISQWARGNWPFSDYGLHLDILGQGGGVGQGRFRKPSDVSKASSIIMEADKILRPNAFPPRPYQQEWILPGTVDRWIHMNGANTTYFDGHSEWFSAGEVLAFDRNQLPWKE